jgi:hypothetical protein
LRLLFKLCCLLRIHPLVKDHYWRNHPTTRSLLVLDDKWVGILPDRKLTSFIVLRWCYPLFTAWA